MTRIYANGYSECGYVALLTSLHVYKFWYNLDTVLYRFLETGTSDRTNIDRDQFLNILGFSLRPSFYLKGTVKEKRKGV